MVWSDQPTSTYRPGGRMSALICEVVYRGIFQKNLAARIVRGIVLSARKSERWGIAFGRYGDSPQRNGIPAKDFAIVADTKEELEQNMARYEPKHVDVTICVDDTLSKGVESWAWYGLQPINRLTVPNGTVLMTSLQSGGELLKDIHRKDAPYKLALIRAKASFSGLWVYKEDHTEVRILGALAKIAPAFLTLYWIQCPDSCFDVMPDGTYDANMEACCGCGVCEAVCPVENCITMVNESVFEDNASQWEMWRKDKAAYQGWLTGKIGDKKATVRSHGFRFRGQYEQELAADLGLGGAEVTAGIPGQNAEHKPV